MFIPRYRTVKGAVAEIKKKDPNSIIKECHIKRMIKLGVITPLKTKQTWFVNLDELLQLFWEKKL